MLGSRAHAPLEANWTDEILIVHVLAVHVASIHMQIMTKSTFVLLRDNSISD